MVSTAPILITGGAGFIGANFVYHIANTYPERRIVVLDALTYAGNRDTIAPPNEVLSYRPEDLAEKGWNSVQSDALTLHEENVWLAPFFNNVHPSLRFSSPKSFFHPAAPQ